MPQKCCVPGCNSNYKTTGSYTTVFSFPKDDNLRKKWVRSINRKDYIPGKSGVVCITHFADLFIVREDRVTRDDGSTLIVPRDRVKLTSDAYPSIFPNQPSYLSNELAPKRKAPEERVDKINARDEEQFKSWCQKDCIRSFEEFINGYQDRANNWVPVSKEGFVFFMQLELSSCPVILVSFKVFADLSIKLWQGETLIDCKYYKWCLGKENKCDKWSKFECIVSHFKSYMNDEVPTKMKFSHISQSLAQISDENDNTKDSEEVRIKCKFFAEQINLISCKPTYSPEMIIWACKLFYSSPSAYNVVRNSNVMTLPHPVYIKRLAATLDTTGSGILNRHVNYLREKAKYLCDADKIVNVLLDEVYVTPTIAYKCGKLTGKAENCDAEATTVQAFMLTSIFSKNKDVVSLVPVKNLTAAQPKNFTVKVLEILNDCGYRVVTLISDNNRINRNMFTMLCGGELQSSTTNPVNAEHKIFLLFDTVHLIKSIRNNWINQSSTNQTFFYPSFNDSSKFLPASIAHLKEISNKERKEIVKQAPKLTRKALYPSSVERQNVKLALDLFDEKNIAALELYSKSLGKDLIHTKEFLEVVLKWWKIVNVKHPLKGKHLRDDSCDSVRSMCDNNIMFLQKFIVWLDDWKAYSQVSSSTAPHVKGGMLSNETYFSLRHSTETLIHLCAYLFENFKLSYILLGKFQTDSLEGRFGRYRQMSGGNYHISVNQVLESERKLKIMSVLNMASARKGIFEIKNFALSCKDSQVDVLRMENEFEEVLYISEEVEVPENTLSTLIYIAGYVAHKVMGNVKCKECRSKLACDRDLTYDCADESVTQYLQLISRGDLMWPQEFTVKIVISIYQVFQCLINEDFEKKFLAASQHRQLLISLTEEKLSSLSIVTNTSCSCGNTLLNLGRNCMKVMANILLNNYSKAKTDKLKTEKSKRKLSTLKV